MSDNVQQQSTQDGQAQSIHAGMKVPFIEPGKKSPSFLSAAFGNLIISFIRALAALKVTINQASLTADGTDYDTHAEVKFAADKMAIDLYLPPPGSSGGGSGTLNYRGTYNSATTYNLGDIVRVLTGSSQGIWICVIANPTSANQPTFPEPVTTGGTNYWDMWAFGVVSVGTCSAGSSGTLNINGQT